MGYTDYMCCAPKIQISLFRCFLFLSPHHAIHVFLSIDIYIFRYFFSQSISYWLIGSLFILFLYWTLRLFMIMIFIFSFSFVEFGFWFFFSSVNANGNGKVNTTAVRLSSFRTRDEMVLIDINGTLKRGKWRMGGKCKRKQESLKPNEEKERKKCRIANK